MLNTYEQNSKRKLIATILTIVVIAGTVVLADHIKAEGRESAPAVVQTAIVAPVAPTPSTNSATATTAPTNTSGFKDGTFSASSNYYVPSGNENIKVSLTIKNGVITDSSIQNSQGDNQSAAYQQDFASIYKSYVVGKKISSLQFGIIAGASDTTRGFDDALNQIASKAQA